MAASAEPVRIGVDLGGTKIEIAALAADGAELLRRRVAAPSGDYAATVAAIAALVNSAESVLGRRCTVGIGIPGSESPATGLIRNANSTALNGHRLRDDIEQALGRGVRIANDANCLAMSEARDGAGAGFATVLTWAIIAFFFRYSSLAALVSAAFAPLFYVFVFGADVTVVTVVTMSVLLLYRHWENIGRLMAGKEKRIGGGKR